VSTAADLDGLGCVWEVDSGGNGDDLESANLAPAVAAVGVAMTVGHGPPGQRGQLGVQGGLVAFDGEDPVRAAFGQVGDMVTLAVQRVGGHHHGVEVTDLLQ
jgi:hypothetical protein